MVAVTKTERDPLLLPERIEPYCLHDVCEKVVDGRRDEIVLDFGDSFLSFVVEPDHDTVACRFHDKPFVSKRSFRRVGTESPWSQYIDKECGWTWLAVNQQGYWDTVLISFDAVIPNVALNVMASSFYVFQLGSTDQSKTSKPKANRKNGR
jgi:hypothetical protein